MIKPWKVLTSLGLAVTLVATATGLKAEASQPIGTVKVKAGSLNARSDDSFSAKIVRVLKKGESYTVYSQSNGMYNIGGGKWTSANSKYVTYTPNNSSNQQVSSSSIGIVTIKSTSLNVRKDASFSAPVVKVVKKGQSYKVYGEKNGLYNVGGSQWVSANTKYVTYQKNGTTAQPAKGTSSNVTTEKQTKVYITASQLNIRQAADFNAKIVGTAKKGQSYTVYEQKNGLYRIGDGKWVTASTKYVSTSGSVTVETSAKPATTSDTQKLINYGKQYMGMRYVWASSNPGNGGFDCSGFIYHVYKNNGYNIKRLNVEGYWNTVKRISTPKVGDLVFFKDTYRKGPSHIGIYLGDGKFLNANSSKGVSIDSINSSYWKKHFLGYGTFN